MLLNFIRELKLNMYSDWDSLLKWWNMKEKLTYLDIIDRKHENVYFWMANLVPEIVILTWYWNIYWNWNVLCTGIRLGLGFSIGFVSTWQDWDLNILINFIIYQYQYWYWGLWLDTGKIGTKVEYLLIVCRALGLVLEGKNQVEIYAHIYLKIPCSCLIQNPS